MSKQPSDLGLRKFMDLGLRMAGAILLFTYLGNLVDGWLGTRPLFLLVLGFLGLAGGMASVYYAIYPYRGGGDGEAEHGPPEGERDDERA